MIIVRSQDRETLGKYVEIKVSENVVTGFSKFGSMSVLGSYSCRERALEVVERIHKCLLEGVNKDYLDKRYRIKQDTVFFMPVE
ncbi:MAG: hypothetical protein RR756_06150 [Cetobacterium sp.]